MTGAGMSLGYYHRVIETHGNTQDVATDDGCHRAAVPYLTANLTTPDVSTAPSAVPSGVDTDVDVDRDLEHRAFWNHGGENSHHHGAPCGMDGNLRFAMLVLMGTAAAWEERTRRDEANARRATMTSNRSRDSRLSLGRRVLVRKVRRTAGPLRENSRAALEPASPAEGSSESEGRKEMVVRNRVLCSRTYST